MYFILTNQMLKHIKNEQLSSELETYTQMHTRTSIENSMNIDNSLSCSLSPSLSIWLGSLYLDWWMVDAGCRFSFVVLNICFVPQYSFHSFQYCHIIFVFLFSIWLVCVFVMFYSEIFVSSFAIFILSDPINVSDGTTAVFHKCLPSIFFCFSFSQTS